MNTDDSLHALLPWYARGSLDVGESEAFREHLERCKDCSADLEWVRKIQDRVDDYGETLLEDHPDPARLVDAVRGEAGGDEVSAIRRHLAVCSTCATEALWVTGEAEARLPDATADPKPQRAKVPSFAAWGWLAAAAAVVLLLLSPFWTSGTRRSAEPIEELYRPEFVKAVERDTDPDDVLHLAPDDMGLQLVFEVDVPTDAFPVELKIERSGGERIYQQKGIRRDHLIDGLYLVVPCSRERCEPGAYVSRCRGSGDTALAVTYRFRIEQNGPPH